MKKVEFINENKVSEIGSSKTLEQKFKALLEELPLIVQRKEVGKLLGGIISPGYLANLDCLGRGPKRVKVGKRAGYFRQDLVKWLEERSQKEG